MADLALIDLLGFWIGIFLTFCILSFLYKDNPFYKFAEHLFIGVSIGYVVTKQYYDTLKPKLIVNLGDGKWWYLIGLVLAIMLLLKLFRKTSHLGRYPIAFVVGLFAGLQITGVAQGDLGKQAEKAMETVVATEVDLNTAPKNELQLLPGFSPSLARKVIERRAEKPFEGFDDLKGLPGLTELQVQDIIDARGSISGLDAQAATLPMLPAQERVAAMNARLEAHIKAFDDKLLGKAAGLLDQTEAAQEMLNNLALSKVHLDTIRYSLNDAHSTISRLELVAQSLIGTPPPGRVGGTFVFGLFSRILLLLGLLAGLIYFYFSIEQKGPIGKVSRFGIWVLMIGFGASFGYTVQGRISLAIGRVLDISGANKDPNLAAQINGVAVAGVSIVIIVVGLVFWELGQRKNRGDGPSGGDDQRDDQRDDLPPAPVSERSDEEE